MFAMNYLRTIYFLLILINIKWSNKWIFCKPQFETGYRRSFDFDDYPDQVPRDYYFDIMPYSNIMGIKGLTQNEKESNIDILNELTRIPVRTRGQKDCDKKCVSCLASCNHIKSARGANSAPLVQYLYLVICAKGCKNMISCVTNKYCLPVMKENPDYFIQCVNSCPLFPIIPRIFVK